MLILHDSDTGASAKNAMRPCLIVAISSGMVIVAPRTASGKGKVATPASASGGFTKEGSFSRWRRPVSRKIAEAAQNHGQLAEPYLGEVQALQNRSKK